LRPAFDALFDIDDAMADVVAESTQPALGAIKLAWWRERLEELDQGKVPSEPRLQAAARELLPRGISGGDLAQLEAGWATLLQEQPDIDVLGQAGGGLFEIAARFLKSSDPALRDAGRTYAFQMVQRRDLLASGLPESDFRELVGRVFPKSLRPLTALTALAVRDLRRGDDREPEATPGRAIALLAHRLTGRIRL